MKLLQTRERRKLFLSYTGIYDIPSDWSSEKLGEVIQDLQSGFASGLRDDNGVIQLRMNNITTDGRFNLVELLKVPIPSDIDDFRLQQDDVIFNNTNSLELIGKTSIVNKALPYTFSNHLTRIRVDKSKILPYWLYLLFLRYRERSVFKSICNTHVGQSGIGKSELRNLQIFFPPLVEQKKIALILSKVDELLQKSDQIIKQTQRLRKGSMRRLLTKGIKHSEFKKVKWHYDKQIEVPKAWKLVLLDEVTQRGTGHTPDAKKPEYYNGGVKWVSLADSNKLDNLYIVETVKEISEKGIENSSAVKHPVGTVIMSRDAGVGKSAILKTEMAVSQHFVTWQCKEWLNNHFLYYVLQYWKPLFESIAIGTTIKTIGLPFFKRLPIILPPLNEQERIASILVNIDLQVYKKQEYNSKLKELKKGLMQKLLTGKIRVKV